jgi:oligopeptide/dipeptide ABC transporter ATP-binding protein
VTALLEVRELHKTFPVAKGTVYAVNGVSFTVAPGEALGLVGESGSGKTTVGRCIAGLETPTAGSIQFQARAVPNERNERHRRVGFVFQEPFDSLNPRMRVGTAVGESLVLGGMAKQEAANRVAETLRLVGLPASMAAQYPFELRANEAQRVGVARAIINRPELIVLDEPTSTLDIASRLEILRLLDRLRQELGVAYIFISHDLTAVRLVCSSVAVMYLGEIVEQGAVEDVFASPIHPYTRALLASVLLPDPQWRPEPFDLRREIPSPLDLPSGCFLHPRCPMAVESCSSEHPSLELVVAGSGSARRVACPVAITHPVNNSAGDGTTPGRAVHRSHSTSTIDKQGEA